MILHLVLGKEIALHLRVVNQFFALRILARPKKFSFGLWMFVTTPPPGHSKPSALVKLRTDIYKSGLLSGKSGALLVLSFCLLGVFFGKPKDRFGLSSQLPSASPCSSGLLSAILTSSLIPVLEWLFGYTTSLKLLELSNFNHPLLHNLMMKAPGTYHHSVIAG